VSWERQDGFSYLTSFCIHVKYAQWYFFLENFGIQNQEKNKTILQILQTSISDINDLYVTASKRGNTFGVGLVHYQGLITHRAMQPQMRSDLSGGYSHQLNWDNLRDLSRMIIPVTLACSPAHAF